MAELSRSLLFVGSSASMQTVFEFLASASGALTVFIYMIAAAWHIRLWAEREARVGELALGVAATPRTHGS